MGDPTAVPESGAQRLSEILARRAAEWGYPLGEWQQRIAQQFTEAYAKNAGPIDKKEDPVEPVGDVAIKVRPDFTGFPGTPKPDGPPVIEKLTKDDVKTHITRMFCEGDIEVDGDCLGTYAFPTKTHVYLAVEGADAEAGTTPARVFRVSVDEIV